LVVIGLPMILIPDFYGIRRVQAGLKACSTIKMKEVKDDFTAS